MAQFKVLSTNGGAHPPEQWAVTTSEFLVDIDPSVTGDRLIAAKKLQAAVAEVMMPQHTSIQNRERSTLGQNNHEQLFSVLDSHAEAEAAYEKVVACAKGTPWEYHFLRDDVRREAVATIEQHMNTVRHIERQWHCHRNRGNLQVESWMSQHNLRGG